MPTFKATGRYSQDSGYQQSSKQEGYVFQWGKYRGISIQDEKKIPTEYLEWIVSSNQRLLDECKKEIDRRASLEHANDTLIEKIINAGYKQLAKQFHPDAGGSAEQFNELQGSREVLRLIAAQLKGVE